MARDIYFSHDINTSHFGKPSQWKSKTGRETQKGKKTHISK